MSKYTREQLIAEGELLLRNASTSTSLQPVCQAAMRDAIEYLKQPTLPPKPTDEMLRAMRAALLRQPICDTDRPVGGIWDTYMRVYKALYAALTTPPAPKEPRNIIVLVRKPIADAWEVHTKNRFDKNDLFTKSEAEQYAKNFPLGWKTKLVEE